MKSLKVLASAAVLVWIIGMVVLALGGRFAVEHSDVAAQALVEASGIKDQVKMVQDERCRQARLNFDQMWDRAVEENQLERMEDALDRARASVDSFCNQS